jgi:hypothetical protein
LSDTSELFNIQLQDTSPLQGSLTFSLVVHSRALCVKTLLFQRTQRLETTHLTTPPAIPTATALVLIV